MSFCNNCHYFQNGNCRCLSGRFQPLNNYSQYVKGRFVIIISPPFQGIYPICGLAQNGLCNLKILAGELVFGTVDVPLLTIAVCKERTSVASIISRHKSMHYNCQSPVSDYYRRCRIRVSISHLLCCSQTAVGQTHRGL